MYLISKESAGSTRAITGVPAVAVLTGPEEITAHQPGGRFSPPGWDQSLEAFGEKGMKKLWSAANIQVAGSGLSDAAFLPFLSQLIGDHDVTRRTTSALKGGRSVSTAIQRERLLDINDLAALPRGRVELERYSTQPYGNDVTASQDYYERLLARSGART